MPPVADHVTAVLLSPVTVAANCRVVPAAKDAEVGEMVTEIAGPAVNVTVVEAVTDPTEFVAVNVWVVVPAGVTVTELPVTEPGVGEILSVVAPVTTQLNVTLCPGTTAGTEDVKLEITGADGVVPAPNLPN